MKKQVRFGVLGYASIARRELIPALVDAENAVPYALASQKEESRKAAQKEFDFAKIYGSYDDLLKDKDVEAVYIPLPNHLHKEWTIKAARAGKHVLCEKPMALTREDCEEMAAEARKNGVLLMEAFMYRFTLRTRKLRELLAQKAVGDIQHVNSAFCFYNDKEDDVRFYKEMGGGAFWDVGCYPVNLMGLIMGEEPVSVRALKTDRRGVDFGLSAVLKYRSGAVCTVTGSFSANSAQVTEINGTKGSLVMRDSFDEVGSPILLIRDGKTEEIAVPASDRYLLQVTDFCDAVLTGRQPGFSLEETIRNVGLIQRIYQAAEE